MSWFPNQFPHFLFSVSWLWTWFNLVAIFVLLRGNMLVLFISNTCFLCTPSFMSGLLRDIYALSRSSYHLHFASHFRTCFLFTTTLLEFHLHFTALSLYLISLGYPNCYVLPLGREVFSTSLRPAQLCSVTSGPSTNLFSVICLKSEPCSYKKCLVSERYAFTPPRDKVSLIPLHLRVTLKSHGKIAYSFSTDFCTACTAHPSLGSGAQHLVPEEEDNYGGFLLVVIVYLGLFSLDCLEILKVISRAV